jgi:PAS domain S-box-containing protein
MDQRNTHVAAAQYLLAASVTLLALLARFILDPALGDHLPYVTFFVAVAITTWYGSLGPSLAAVLLGGLAAIWFFMPPRYSFALVGLAQQIGYLTYFMVSLVFVGFGQALQKSRQRAELVKDALRERDMRLAIAMQEANMGAWEVDLQTGRNVWDEHIPVLLGIPPEAAAAAALNWTERIHPEDRARVLAEFKAAVEEGAACDTEFRVLRTDGAVRWFSSRGKLLSSDDDEAARRMVGLLQDITERKEAEAARRESEERFGALVTASSDALYRMSPDWTEMRQLHGRNFLVDQESPTCAWLQEYIHADDQPQVMAAIKEAIRVKGMFELEHRIRRAGGAMGWTFSRAIPLLDNKGDIVEWFGAASDITERKEAEKALLVNEERLRSAADRLEQLVHERTAELLLSQERLRALTTELNLAEHRERQRLAAELHDHLAQMLVLGKLKLSQTKQLRDLTPACLSLIKDTEDVLTKSLTYTRTLVADLAPPVLREFGLPAALPWLADQMHRYELAVTVTLPDSDDLQLPEDQAVLIFQSVRELLMNVAKHAETGQAALSLQRCHDQLRLEIRDEGMGFDLCSLAANAQSAAGHGFGLFSIRERMLALGGRFELCSAPGRGTTATLLLPLRPKAMSATHVERGMLNDELSHASKMGLQPHGTGRQQTSGSASEDSAFMIQHSTLPPQARLRVLVADDHAMVRQGLRSILSAYQDISVAGEAANGEEAVRLAGQIRPDVILMDVNMPKMDGIEATRRIKEAFPAMMVIGLSVQDAESVETAMKQAGAVAFVNKEAAVEDLYQTIEDARKELLNAE